MTKRWLLGSLAWLTTTAAWSVGSVAMCLGCHKSVAADSFVFTLGKLKEHSTR